MKREMERSTEQVVSTCQFVERRHQTSANREFVSVISKL
jgi:hypothetical protein